MFRHEFHPSLLPSRIPSTNTLASNSIRQSAARAFAVTKFLHCGFQVSRREIRPAFCQKYEFREGALPQEKIGKPLLSPGADQQVDVRRAAAQHLRQHIAEGIGRKFRYFVKAA